MQIDWLCPDVSHSALPFYGAFFPVNITLNFYTPKFLTLFLNFLFGNYIEKIASLREVVVVVMVVVWEVDGDVIVLLKTGAKILCQTGLKLVGYSRGVYTKSNNSSKSFKNKIN